MEACRVSHVDRCANNWFSPLFQKGRHPVRHTLCARMTYLNNHRIVPSLLHPLRGTARHASRLRASPRPCCPARPSSPFPQHLCLHTCSWLWPQSALGGCHALCHCTNFLPSVHIQRLRQVTVYELLEPVFSGSLFRQLSAASRPWTIPAPPVSACAGRTQAHLCLHLTSRPLSGWFCWRSFHWTSSPVFVRSVNTSY